MLYSLVLMLIVMLTATPQPVRLQITVSDCSYKTLYDAVQTAKPIGGDILVDCDDVIEFGYGTHQLVIEGDISIKPFRTSGIIIDGGYSGRLFYVNEGASLTLENLTLQHFSLSSEGAVLYNNGAVTMTDVVFRDNRGTFGRFERGGLIFNGETATLTIADSAFVGNQDLMGTDTAIIYNYRGDVSITNSDFLFNQIRYSHLITNDGGDMTISDSQFFNSEGYHVTAILHQIEAGSLELRGNIFMKWAERLNAQAIRNESGTVISEANHYENLSCYGDVVDAGGNTAQNTHRCLGDAPQRIHAQVSDCNQSFGDGSVLDAIVRANVGGGDIRLICSPLPLTHTLLIADAISITSPRQYASLDGRDQTQLFRVMPRGALTLNNLHLEYGRGEQGGAIVNTGELMLYDTTFANNSAAQGGAIFNDGGRVWLYGNTFHDNSAGRGGGIYTQNGTLFIHNTDFLTNSAADAGALYIHNTPTRILSSRFKFNRARVGNGAGIWHSTSPTPTLLIISDTIFADHLANERGGAVYNENLVVIHNSQVADNFSVLGGSAITNNNGVVMLWRSTFRDNGVIFGDAISDQSRRNPYARINSYGSTYHQTTCADEMIDLGDNNGGDWCVMR